MIRFQCPSCSVVYEGADAQAGEKFECSRCGQRMEIPHPAPSLKKTILAPLVDPCPVAIPLLSPVPPPPPPLLSPPLTMPSKRIVVGVLAIAFGWMGAHNWFLRRYLMGILTPIVCFLLCRVLPIATLVLWVFAIAEGVWILCMTDEQFERHAAIDW